MKYLCVFFGLAAGAVLTGSADASQAVCANPENARVEIERTVQGFFEALRKDDQAAFERLTTDSFHAFDVGERFSGNELFEAVRDAHAQGVQIEWSLGPISTEIRCDAAWSDWENVGSAGIPPDTQPVRWLESAVLVHKSGNWEIDFFHSQRAKQN